jgi:transcriptional/translational regulatory protein YebC/TACO1
VEDAAKVEALLNEIEENDDVTAVHTNFSPPAPTAE